MRRNQNRVSKMCYLATTHIGWRDGLNKGKSSKINPTCLATAHVSPIVYRFQVPAAGRGLKDGPLTLSFAELSTQVGDHQPRSCSPGSAAVDSHFDRSA